MKQIFTVKWQKNLRAMALCLTALPLAQGICTPVLAADLGKSDRFAEPQGNFDNARYSSSSEWKITLGVGAAYAPKYEGSDKLEAGAVPLVSVEYGDTLSIDFSGVTVNLLNSNGFRLGVKGGWEAGRKEKDERKIFAEWVTSRRAAWSAVLSLMASIPSRSMRRWTRPSAGAKG